MVRVLRRRGRKYGLCQRIMSAVLSKESVCSLDRTVWHCHFAGYGHGTWARALHGRELDRHAAPRFAGQKALAHWLHKQGVVERLTENETRIAPLYSRGHRVPSD